MVYISSAGGSDVCQLQCREIRATPGGQASLRGSHAEEADFSPLLGRERENIPGGREGKMPLSAWVPGLSGGTSGFLSPVSGFFHPPFLFSLYFIFNI